MKYWKLGPFGEECAFAYGRLHGELQRLGRPMQTIDVMTASIARKLRNCTVVTVDSDFLRVPNLNVEN